MITRYVDGRLALVTLVREDLCKGYLREGEEITDPSAIIGGLRREAKMAVAGAEAAIFGDIVVKDRYEETGLNPARVAELTAMTDADFLAKWDKQVVEETRRMLRCAVPPADEKYPECAKLLAASKESQAQGEFLAWLQEEKAFVLAEWDEEEDIERAGLVPVCARIEDLLAEFHGIDMTKVENERRAMLEEMRKAHES